MRLRATCMTCEKDFLFFELYNGDTWNVDKCPRCGAHLGVNGLRQLARAADSALLSLRSALEQISDRDPAFKVHVEPWLSTLKNAAHPAPVVTRGNRGWRRGSVAA